jgi:uncharacterized OsmC-like protein
MTMDLKSRQAPLKEQYGTDAGAALITLKAEARHGETSTACSIDIGRAVYEAQAHAGVGGAGTAACSGDLLLGALAACAQITCQMVAESQGVPIRRVDVTVEGDLDLRGTLGIARRAPVGFAAIRTRFQIDAPEATAEQIERLSRASEAYCTVLQTLRASPPITTEWDRS